MIFDVTKKDSTKKIRKARKNVEKYKKICLTYLMPDGIFPCMSLLAIHGLSDCPFLYFLNYSLDKRKKNQIYLSFWSKSDLF